MRNIHLIILSFIAAVALWSCTAPSADDTIARAEEAVAAGDFASARCVESLAADTVDLSPSQLCRVALVYMHLAESDRQTYDEDVTAATQCYLRALKISPDSVAAFCESMAVSDLTAMNTLNELGSAITSPVDITETPADTIPDIYLPQDNE